MSFRRLIPLGAAASLLAVNLTPAMASWPQARHDAARTATANGISNLTAPLPHWRYFLGGRTLQYQLFAIDQRPRSLPRVAVVRGSKLRMYEAGMLRPIWTFDELPVISVSGLADFDGDGKDELVARSGSQTAILDPETGSALWVEPRDELGSLGSARYADFDGDGKRDMLLQECGCCSVNSGHAGFVYSFGSGYSAPKLLWEMPQLDCAAVGATSVLDVDGDGSLEVVVSRNSQPDLLRAADGAELSVADPVPGFQWARCYGVNINSDPELELVCTVNRANSEGNGHQVMALDYLPDQNQMVLLWRRDVGVQDNKLGWPQEPFLDLDENGLPEALVSGELADGTPTTELIDLTTGLPLMSLEGHAAVLGAGSIASSDSTANTVVSFTQTGEDLNAVMFSPPTATGGAHAEVLWTLFKRRLLQGNDRREELDLATTGVTAPALLDIDSDGNPEFLVANADQTLIEAYRYTSSGPELAAILHDDPAVQVTTLSVMDVSITRPGEHPLLVTAYSDGRLILQDQALTTLGVPIRAGGYLIGGDRQANASHPVAGRITGGADSVLVTNSSGTLQQLDAAMATLSRAPRVVWQRAHSDAPVIADDGSGEFYCISHLPVPASLNQQSDLVQLGGAGLERWHQPLGAESRGDLVLAHLASADGEPASASPVVTIAIPDSDQVSVEARSAVDGALLGGFMTSVSAQFQGLSAADVDLDGVDDISLVASDTEIYSGASFELIASFNAASNYGTLSFANLDTDAALESVVHSGNGATRSIDNDYDSLLWIDAEGGSYAQGSLLACPDGRMLLVEPRSASPGRLDLVPVSGPPSDPKRSLVLWGGQLYASEAAAEAAGARPIALASTAAHANLTGDGWPTVAVGAADGWLYAVNPCQESLLFAVQFQDSVGVVLFADTDGDGNDELLASVADGYLYGLKQPSFAGPGWVLDEDEQFSGADIDVLDASATLRASWAPVADATAYEVSVSLSDGTNVTDDWLDVGDVAQYAFDDIELVPGSLYVVAVRAVSPFGPSVDTLSDGVLVPLPGQELTGPVEAPDAAVADEDAGVVAMPPEDPDDSMVVDDADAGGVQMSDSGTPPKPTTADAGGGSDLSNPSGGGTDSGASPTDSGAYPVADAEAHSVSDAGVDPDPNDSQFSDSGSPPADASNAAADAGKPQWRASQSHSCSCRVPVGRSTTAPDATGQPRAFLVLGGLALFGLCSWRRRRR